MPVPKDLTSGFLPEIFDRQRSTMEKFEHIEASNGGLQTSDCPVDLNSFPGQARLRDFGWRITEELSEVYVAYRDLVYKNNQMGNVVQLINTDTAEVLVEMWDKFNEEIMDCLHFLVEFSILSGYDFNGDLHKKDVLNRIIQMGQINSITIEKCIFNMVIELGSCINLLRNRAWKQKARDTDVKLFYRKLDTTWFVFGELLACASFTPRAVFIGYCGKNEINKQRQESGV